VLVVPARQVGDDRFVLLGVGDASSAALGDGAERDIRIIEAIG
jgi:hypothetical protein